MNVSAAGPVPKAFIIHLFRAERVADSLRDHCHFLQMFCPGCRIKIKQFNDMLLMQEQCIPLKMLEISNNHVAGFKFFYEKWILALSCFLNSFTYTAHIYSPLHFI